MIPFFVGLVLTIPISILANLCTPFVKAWAARRGASRRQRRIANMVAEAQQITAYREGNVSALVAYSAFNIMTFILSLSIAVAFIISFAVVAESAENTPALTDFLATMSITTFFAAAYQGTMIQNVLKAVYRFDRYQQRVTRQLNKLGGSPKVVWPDESGSLSSSGGEVPRP